MGKPYGDDLRRKLLTAYDEGEGDLEDLAMRFAVSLGWAKKISAARNRTGQVERVPHRPGRKPRVGVEQRQLVMDWVKAQPDLTLAEIQTKLHDEVDIQLGLTRIWHLLKRLGLRLKKSRSTPANATPRPTANSAKSSSVTSRRSRRSD
jgi:transposase